MDEQIIKNDFFFKYLGFEILLMKIHWMMEKKIFFGKTHETLNVGLWISNNSTVCIFDLEIQNEWQMCDANCISFILSLNV